MSAQSYFNGPQQGYNDPKQYAPIAPNGAPPNGNGNGAGNWEMKPSQPYALQPSYPPPQSGPYDPEGATERKWGDSAPFSQQTENTGQRLNPKSRLNDPIFLILFLVNLGGWAAVSAIAIKSFIAADGLGGGFGSSTQGGTGSGITLNS